MKKILAVVLCAALMLTLAISVSAADAFAGIEFDSNTPDSEVELWDDPDTKDEGGSGQEIQKMDDYGVGYSSTNDQVIFHNVDFGANGANKFHVYFSLGNDSETTLAVYLGPVADGNKLADITVTGTGGWTKDCAEDFAADVTIPGGVHDIVVVFTNSNSGSFAKISFDEAPAAAVVEEPAAVVVAPAAQTADLAVVAVIALGAAVVAKKH